MAEQKKHNHDGHRQRMLQRYLQNGIDDFEDHELLEIFLYSFFSRRDTHDMAYKLLDAFGSLDGVMAAGYDKLIGVDGIGRSAAALTCFIADFADYINQEHTYTLQYNFLNKDKFVYHDYFVNKVIGYCHDCLSDGSGESFHAVFFDKFLNYVNFETIKMDSETQFPFDFRAVAGKSLDMECPNLFLIHSRPDSPALPSSADIAETRLIMDALDRMSINLIDHIIVHNDDILSMRYAYRELWDD